MSKAWYHSDKRHLICEVNQPKSRLIDIHRELATLPRSKKAAEELGTIIGRLEAWQHKHGRTA